MTNDDRMSALMSQLPQNRGVDWDAVMPVIEFTFQYTRRPSKGTKAEHQESNENAKAYKANHGLLWLQVC